MDNPEEPPGIPVRRTLKLKVPSSKTKTLAPRAAASVAATSRPMPARQQPRDPNSWSDVYKKKMQADMDALALAADASTRDAQKR